MTEFTEKWKERNSPETECTTTRAEKSKKRDAENAGKLDENYGKIFVVERKAPKMWKERRKKLRRRRTTTKANVQN